MTDSHDQAPTQAPSHAAAKGAALGLGLLLLAGTALMVTLLITRGTGDAEFADSPIALEPGETISDLSLDGDRALLLIEKADGEQRVLYVHLTTGERKWLELSRSERSVTE